MFVLSLKKLKGLELIPVIEMTDVKLQTSGMSTSNVEVYPTFRQTLAAPPTACST
jgi:hypothetical protein